MPRFLDEISYYDTNGTLRTVAPMFQHNITLTFNQQYLFITLYTNFINDVSTSYNQTNLVNYLKNKGFDNSSSPLMATGIASNRTEGYNICGLYVDGSSLTTIFYDATGAFNPTVSPGIPFTTVIDNVVEL